MRVDPLVALDGFREVTGGINSAVPPFLLPRTQFSRAINVSFRNYSPQTRPGWIKRSLRFLGPDGSTSTSLQTNFEDYIFQGATAFERENLLVVSVGGRLFRITMDQWDVLDVTPSGTSANPQLYRAWFAEAENFIIRQDGLSAPWIFDGGATRISNTMGVSGTKEIPVGKAMTYSQGRLVVSLPNGRAFVVGDIVGGPSGTAAYNFKDAILKFTENDIILGGGSFSVPLNAGTIEAIRPVAQVDTSLGQGPTQIFATNAILALNTPSQRATWQFVNYPIQTFSAIQAGSRSDRSTVNVNGDLWTRAQDGVRSFVVARRNFGSWVNTPQSRELDWIMSRDDQSLLLYSSAAVFDNRLFVTVRPYRNFQHGVPHDGLAVLDFSPVASLGQAFPPVWNGIWTGLKILQVVGGTFKGVERCFIFALDAGNNITLWEMTKDQVNDNPLTGDLREIDCSFETGAYGFPDASYDLKRLVKGWLWVAGMNGTIDILAYFKEAEDQCWHAWHSWSICATTETCGTTRCLTPQNLQMQYRKPFLLPTPPGDLDSSTGVPNNVGHSFQLRLEWSGTARFSKFLMGCEQEQENVTQTPPQSESCASVTCCPPQDFSYTLQ